jgi:hypothetical protein
MVFGLFKKRASPEQTGKPRVTVVVPRIKHRNFVSYLKSLPAITEQSMPIVEPLFGDLVLTFAADTGDKFIMLSEERCAEYKIARQDLLFLATTNGLQGVSTLVKRPIGSLIELTADENMAACSCLYPKLWEQVENEIGGEPVVAFPHRDLVLFTGRECQSATDELRAAVRALDFAETHGPVRFSVCEALYVVLQAFAGQPFAWVNRSP